MKLKISSRKFQNLKSLGEDRLHEIDSRLISGEPCSAIARTIQTEWGKLKDIKPESLKKTLERYRETELRERTLARIAEAQRGQSIKTVQKRLNALEEMEELVKKQVLVFDKVLMRESQLPEGIVLKDRRDEARLLKDMLVDLGRLQLETGLLARAPKTIKGHMTSPTGEVRQFEWTEEQEELYRAIEAAECHAEEGA